MPAHAGGARDLKGFQSVCVTANVGDGSDGRGMHWRDGDMRGGGERLQLDSAGSL